jgi:hypothetical protein
MADSNCDESKGMVDTDSSRKRQQRTVSAGSRVAPAVALLLLGDSVSAGDTSDFDEDTISVTEPSILALATAGVVVAGAVSYIRHRRRKK